MNQKELHPVVLKLIPRFNGSRDCEERYQYYSNFSDLLYMLDRLRLPYEIGSSREIAGDKVTFKTFHGYNRDVFPRGEGFYSEDLAKPHSSGIVTLREIEKWLQEDWNMIREKHMRSIWHEEQGSEY